MAEQTDTSLEAAIGSALTRTGLKEFDENRDRYEAEDETAPEQKAEEAADEQTTEDGEQEAEAGAEETEAEAEDTPAETEWPEHWSKERRELFEQIPAEVRPRLLDEFRSHENGYNTKFQELAERRRAVDEIEAALEPIRPQLQAQGISPAQAVSQYVGWQRYLAGSPGDALGMLVEHYGRPLAGSGQARDLVRRIGTALGVQQDAGTAETQQAGEDDDAIDPVAARRIQALEAKLSEFERSQQSSQQANAEAQIQQFRSATDADGQPLHPHFEQVKTAMGMLMQAEPGLTMEQAYERAVWATPDTRKTLLESQEAERRQKVEAERAEQAAKAEKERKEAVKKSRQASQTPKSRGTPNGETTMPESWDDAIGNALDRLEVPL